MSLLRNLSPAWLATVLLVALHAGAPFASLIRPAMAAEKLAGASRALLRGEEWPKWRGPRGDGTWNGPKLPEKWPEAGLKRAWRKEIGGGYAGVTVAGGRVYLFDRRKEPREVERIVCYSADDGAELWTHEYPVEYGKLDYGNGPRAAPTVEGDRVYTLGAVGDLRCLDAGTGKPVWTANLKTDFSGRQPDWGYSASPFLHDNLLIVQPGGEGTSVAALNPANGRRVWTSLSDLAAYATPIVVEHEGEKQLICWTPSHIRALELRSGKPCWDVPYEVQYGVSIATPIFREGMVFVSAYWAGSKAIRPVPPGEKPDLAYEENRYLRGLMSQPLYREGHGYLLDKQYGLTCFEFKTGKKLWDDQNRMTPRGRNPQATLVWIGDEDRAIILNSEGELILARLNPRGYHEESRTKILGETWAHPAYAGSRVFARSDTELVCYELPVVE